MSKEFCDMFFQLKRYWEAGGLHANKWRGPASHCCLWTWSVRSTAVDGDPLGLVTYSFSCDRHDQSRHSQIPFHAHCGAPSQHGALVHVRRSRCLSTPSDLDLTLFSSSFPEVRVQFGSTVTLARWCFPLPLMMDHAAL